MTITARNIGRINVWPTYDVARAADTEASKYVGQLTVWRTSDEAQANTSHEEEGGDDAPLIFIDFVNNTATNNGATVAIDTLVGTDPNTNMLWEATEYDPAGLTENGYEYMTTDNQMPLAFIGALRDTFLAGGTLVYQTKQAGEDTKAVALIAGASNGSDAVQVDAMSGSVRLVASSYGGTLEFHGADVCNTGAGAINRIAVTLVIDRIDMSANGEAGVTAPLTGDEFGHDRPPENPFVAVVLDTESAIQSIALYAALPSTDGLSELSEI